jgi:hypothetical protein
MDQTRTERMFTARNSEVAAEEGQAGKVHQSRRFLISSLTLLAIVFLSAGSGIAFSVIVALYELQSDGNLDIPSRIVLFAASCIGVIYVLVHITASSRVYARGDGASQVIGQLAVTLAFILAWLSVLTWIGAVVMMALVAAGTGWDVARGVEGNMPWIGLLICAVAL